MRRAPSRLTTRNGRATKVWASTTAVVENAIWMPSDFEGSAQQSLPAERVEQRDAAHHRRQHQRQQDEGPEQPLAREVAAGQHQRQRHPEHDAQQRARGRRAQAEPQGGRARTRR